MINDASIYSAIVVSVAALPQLLYFLIKGKKNLPEKLYHGRYLLFALLALFSYLALIVTTLFFSNDYGNIGRLFGWLILSHSGFGLILVSWIWFIMHGYDLHYLFKRIVVPAHMNVLIILIYLFTVMLSLNYWALIPFLSFTAFSLIWSLEAYKLTKPNIDKNVPLREDDEY